MMSISKCVVVGASDKPDRYSYKAFMLLKENGYDAIGVHRRIKNIEGHAVVPSLAEVEGPVDTITLYVKADISATMMDAILKLMPRRIIFNPGAENMELYNEAKQAGIEVQNACTLVMLKTGQF